MLKNLSCLFFVLLFCGRAAAQYTDDEYYPYDSRAEERIPLLLTDSALFYRAVQSAEDLFARQTDYNLSFVAFKRRGQGYTDRPLSLDGICLPIRYASAFRQVGLDEMRYAGLSMTPGRTGGADGIREYSLFPDERSASRYAAVSFTDRNYRVRARFSAAGQLGRGWSYSAAADVRAGRDMYIEGVFTNALSVSCQMVKRFGDGHDLALLLVVPPGMRGLRSSSVKEAFTLLDDPLYNPAWGFQDGKVRNSHIRRDCQPLLVAAYRLRISPSTTMSAAFGAEAGVSKYSTLGWYDAQTPMPDNYRFLPGFTDDRETGDAWRTNDTRRTQVDWDELWAQNRMNGRAVYALEDRVERICNLHGNLFFSTDLTDRLALHYGLSFRRSDSRYYKQMRDLLGAPSLADIDQYLVDDDTYGNKLQNDLRHPNRTIGEGDRFGYDYNLTEVDAGVRMLIQYRSDRLRVEVGAELRETSVRRRGNYEKELFPGALSYGKSRRQRFTPYAVKALAGWSFSPRSYLEVALSAGEEPPRAEDLFWQPQYNNRIVDDPESEKTCAAEMNYRFAGRTVTLQATAFVVSAFDGMQTRRYYDDLSSTFCDMAVSGVGKLAYGLEVAADWRVSYRWTLSLAASAGRYKYSRDPRLTVLSDVDNTVVDSRAKSYMGGCEAGGAPRLAGTVGVVYFGPKGWGFRAAANYAGRRYVEPAFLRRTERIARQAAGSHEAFDTFMAQERLDDAFALDASAFKSFWFRRSRLTVSVMLRNLLGDRRMFYNGYESLRVGRQRSGDTYIYAPHATRYTSVYPRSFYLTVSYKF